MRRLWVAHLSKTPVGPIGIVASPAGLIAIQIGVDDVHSWARTRCSFDGTRRSGGVAGEAAEQLNQYFQGRRRAFQVPVDWETLRPFQRSVLKSVAAIPFGETRTYSQIAAEIGRPRAQRAVGRANATNPVVIILPCHRVVGADGSLRGYGAPGGIDTKAWLLQHERAGV